MVMPYAHLDRLAVLPVETAHELMDLAQRTERVLDRVYSPQLNFGLNVGKAAGAGVAGHLHLQCHTALDLGRHELYHHGGRNARAAGRSGRDLETAAFPRKCREQGLGDQKGLIGDEQAGTVHLLHVLL